MDRDPSVAALPQDDSIRGLPLCCSITGSPCAAASLAPLVLQHHRLRTTVNCINAFTGDAPDDQSIDAETPAGTANRMYAAPPAFTDTFTGDPSDKGSTASGYRARGTPLLERCGKMSR